MPVIRTIRNLDAAVKKDETRTVTDFLNVDYRAYAHYVIATRALPSLVDGFKTGARKIMHSAFHGGMKGGQTIKQLNLVGDVYNLCLYAHGDASLNGTITTLASEFLDNLNPITITGQHGSLRDPKAVSAPRYLYLKLSDYADLLYKNDEDLLEYVFDEGAYLEPYYYLPIIPTVLTSRAEGMAPGYKFSCMSYHPLDIIDACIEFIKNGVIKTRIRPYVRNVKSKNFTYDDEKCKWYNLGEYKADEKNDILQINDLPYDVTYEKFEKRLNALIDKEYIKDWKNFSHDNVIDYRILFNKTKMAREMQADRKVKTLQQFMLSCSVPDDLLWVIDENDKVKHFDTKEDLLMYFVKFRLTKYQKRKDNMIGIIEKKIADNNVICKFIDLVNKKKIVVSNRPIVDLKKDLDANELPYSVLSIPISKLTLEERDALNKLNKEYEERIEYIKATSIEQMYIDDLKELKKTLKDDYPD